MAKLLRRYKGFLIKQTGIRDNTTYKYWVCKLGNLEPEWKADNEKECIEFIDSYWEDDK